MFSTLSEHTHTHFHAYTYKHPDCWHASVGSSHTCSSACRALPDERLQSPVRCLTPCSVAQIGVTSCWWYLYSPILRYDAYIHIHIDIDIHTAPICIVYMIILLLKHNSFFNTQQVDMNNWIICLLYIYICIALAPIDMPWDYITFYISGILLHIGICTQSRPHIGAVYPTSFPAMSTSNKGPKNHPTREKFGASWAKECFLPPQRHWTRKMMTLNSYKHGWF